ncbi:MAG: histone deacetylase family protein [Elioraea sp.]|nr:histone deacetylase family protein [Elioraea sp.]
MDAFFHPDQTRHAPQFFLRFGRVVACFETPARAEALLLGVRGAGLAIREPALPDLGELAAVHDPSYLGFLRDSPREWAGLPGAGAEVVPNMHPTPEMLAHGARAPEGVVGRAGWFLADTACAIGPDTWASAVASAGAALAAADAVAGGARAAYALCRPPGHHAYSRRAGGHCYLNNAALAAERLRRAGAARVAVLDLDVHHGNGTQGIFWHRGDVLTVSVHGDPRHFYPWFVGHADERGEGPGEGTNLNLPLPRGADDEAWLAAVADGAAAVRRFGADALVVALGFDAWVGEPLGFLAVSEDGFARAAATVSALGLPSVLVQEGGYAVDALPKLVVRFLSAWRG